MQNIFVYEAIEITKHDGITIVVYQLVIRVCEMKNDPTATEKNPKRSCNDVCAP